MPNRADSPQTMTPQEIEDVFVTLGLPLTPQAPSAEKIPTPVVYFPITGNSPPVQPQVGNSPSVVQA